MKIELTKLEKEMIRELIDTIKKSNTEVTTITYSELSSKFGIRQDHISKQLGNIAEFCIDIDVPPISAIVVNNKSRKPGSGLYEVLRNKPKDYDDYIEEAQSCKNWSKLERYL